jgi:hypothetical protein
MDLKKKIYNVVYPIAEVREKEGSYKGKASHLAYIIADAVYKEISENREPRFQELTDRLVAPGCTNGRFSASELQELHQYITE